jgi:hypothetical protein
MKVEEHDGIGSPRHNSESWLTHQVDIVKMHSRSCRVHISPAVQNLSERIDHVLTEGVAVELFPREEPVDEDGAPDAQKYCEHHFWASVVGLLLVGTLSADTHPILS